MDERLSSFYKSLSGKFVSFLGIGVSNLPLILKFASLGAQIEARDQKCASEFSQEILGALKRAGVFLRMGGEYLEELSADLIVRSPGIRPDLPEVRRAVEKGALLTSEIELLFEYCPAPILAVTGSDGKTTTTTLISEMLRAGGKTPHLGGNIGTPLFAEIEKIKKEDFSVVELSSFQLMGMKKSPGIAVVTNVAPNHLDWHTGMEEYETAKMNIFLYQGEKDRLVLNADNEKTRAYAEKAPSEVYFFSTREKVARGAYLEDGKIYMAEGKERTFIMEEKKIRLPGRHNVENLLAAIAAVFGLVDVKSIRAVAESFAGVEHRIEFVREFCGVRYYNDSIASSPSRARAGLLSFNQKLILIAGGYDKKIPFDEFGEILCERVKRLILIGKTADAIESAVVNAKNYPGCGILIEKKGDFESAVRCARDAAEDGDIVLLSPACASFDLFKNFAERGETFKNIVNAF